ncbi:AbrB family transcriptional regulator [Asaia sp. As-1742]|uniref:AbrB family transcriptional regulator n=1 Tax=Asaia sp. As-1742 TaxID=2608325 RepID=UPI00142124E5|nr:AbrB family transcriptional regulator [Asaia sp. As-1742]NIE80539.1 AbrB family transcriptional regulator [Asaia sp. As-1742]
MKGQVSLWLGLIALSALLGGGLTLLGLPAALLIGAMVAAIAVAVSGRVIPLHRTLPVVAQAVIGQLMAHSLTLGVLREILSQWSIFLGGVFSVIVMSFALGWVLARLRVMPGSTALWGASPGAATAMLLLCVAYGADQRLVAFMVYLRVLLVTLTTSIIAHITSSHRPMPHDASTSHASLTSQVGMPETVLHLIGHEAATLWPCLAVIACAVLLARFVRHGAAPLLLSMAGGVILQAGFGVHYALPHFLLVPSYMVIGWMVGRRFTRDVMHHVWRTLPAVTLSTLILIGGCALLSWPLAHIAHVDVLSAYLATSPGGADSIAIIAASTPINMPFVMAMQVARFLSLLVIAPRIATTLARFLPPDPDAVSSQTARNTDSA